MEPAAVGMLLVAVAGVFTCLGFAIAPRGGRRSRGPFVLGVLCGTVAGPVLARRSRHVRALRATIRRADRFAARVLARAASDAHRQSWSPRGRASSNRRGEPASSTSWWTVWSGGGSTVPTRPRRSVR